MTTDERTRRLIRFLNRKDNRALIEQSIVGDKPFDRLMGEVSWSVFKNPEILDCEPDSIAPAVARAAEWDLQIGERAYLIPRYAEPFSKEKPRLTAMLHWVGEITLLKRYKIVSHVDVNCVYEHDHFVPTFGMKPWVDHRREKWTTEARGPLVGAYAWVRLARSPYDTKLVVMDAPEINAVRTTWSELHRMGSLDDKEWYPKKTCVHKLAKELSIEPQWKRMFSDDDDQPRALEAAA